VASKGGIKGGVKMTAKRHRHLAEQQARGINIDDKVFFESGSNKIGQIDTNTYGIGDLNQYQSWARETGFNQKCAPTSWLRV
jgi:hypothetical protein